MMKHFGCVRDAIFIQFRIFLCLYSVEISHFCLIKGWLSCNPFIFFALLLFFSKGEKNTKRKKTHLSLPKLRPLSLHALVSKIACIAKDWLSIFSLLNSWSFKARNLKMLLQINVVCNFVYSSLAKLNHCYLIKDTHFKVVHRITDLFFKMYFLFRKRVPLFLFFPPFRSLILGPDFQLSTQDSINISVNCSCSTPLQMKLRSV